jgi:hypothetical protein
MPLEVTPKNFLQLIVMWHTLKLEAGATVVASQDLSKSMLQVLLSLLCFVERETI